jgi:SAM-dependent methyltransferase
VGLRNAIQALQAPIRKRRIRRRPAEEIWQDNLSTEVRFWQRFLTTGGSEWPEEYAFRRDPDAELQEHVKAVIDLPAGAVARILDVGAGPLTYLGKRWEGRTVEITAVDALADEYDRLLAEGGIEPPVRTSKCDSEHLLDRFSRDSFDLAYARNALDHGYDPLGALSQMVAVVKPGARILIEHLVNEGKSGAYYGLHQWNFAVDGNAFILWSPRGRIDIGDALSAEVVRLDVDPDTRWMTAVLEKPH